MLFHIELGAFAGDHPEILVEAGEIIEPALVAKLFDADPVVDEQFAGVADAYFRQELCIGLACPGFKVAAEGIRYESGHGRYLVKVDLLAEMAEGIIINSVDAVVLRFGKIRAEADGGQYLQVVRPCKGGEAFDQCDDPVDAFCRTDLFHLPRDLSPFFCAGEDTPPGLVQQVTYGFGLWQLEEGSAPEVL